MDDLTVLQYSLDLTSLPVGIYANTFPKSLDNVALFLGALTAGGGITGYVRTGSIPSVAAGITVGALV
jgi:hypothetical protein